MKSSIIDLVSKHIPSGEIERDHTVKTLDFLHKNDDCTSTENLSGHITASAWLVSPDNSEVLLTHHKKLNRWLQLGGHIEGDDATIQDAAFRETVEESGIKQVHFIGTSIFDIDVHLIPSRKDIPEHYHYDIRFALQAGHKKFTLSDESNKLAWVKINDIADLNCDESLMRMCRKTLALLES